MAADSPTEPAHQEPILLPDRAKAKRRRRLALAAFVAVAGLVGYLVMRPSGVEDDGIRTEAAEVRTLSRVITITGHVDVAERVDVPAPLGGALIAIEVQPGDRVEAGQPLARLDPRRSELALGSARSTLTASTSRVAIARATVDGARTQLEQIQRLVARELASEVELQNARLQAEQAEAALRAARAEQAMAATGVTTAEISRESGLLRAPIAGVILKAPRSLGTLVGPEHGAIFVIGRSLDSLRIDANVGEADVGFVRTGMAATFDVPAYPGRVFEASLVRIELDAHVDPGAVSYPLQFVAANPDSVLRPGMSTQLRLEVAHVENALSVHEAALRFTPEGAPPAAPRTRVWKRVGPNHLEPIEVEAGVSDGAHTAVTPRHREELPPGTPIVIGIRLDETGGRAGISLGSGRRRATP